MVQTQLITSIDKIEKNEELSEKLPYRSVKAL
jgi:hypothetical protein